MATRTPAQQAAWKKRFTLGSITSLSRWIRSKESIIASADGLTREERTTLVDNMHDLCRQLDAAAIKLGWKPK